jgi:hypothetical protein
LRTLAGGQQQSYLQALGINEIMKGIGERKGCRERGMCRDM